MPKKFRDWLGVSDYIDPTGKYYRGKTIWDLLEIIIVPGALIIGAFLLNRSLQANSERIEADRAGQLILQNYFDDINELLTESDLRVLDFEKSVSLNYGNEDQVLARALTLATLRSLDGERKGLLIEFLYELGLIHNVSEPSIRSYISLTDANLTDAQLSGATLFNSVLLGVDLSEANLSKAWLNEAILNGAILYKANLNGARLSGAQLSGADLREADLRESDIGPTMVGSTQIGAFLNGADLRGAKLNGANLSLANLSDAKVSAEQLATVESLEGAIMPDGKTFDPSIHIFP